MIELWITTITTTLSAFISSPYAPLVAAAFAAGWTGREAKTLRGVALAALVTVCTWAFMVAIQNIGGVA